MGSQVATSLKLNVPHFDPPELPALAKKRQQARRALGKLELPTDKKYTNWERLGLPDWFLGKAIGGLAPTFTINQKDYDTGLKTIAIPLSRAIKDWPDHVSGYLMGKALPSDFHYFSALSGATYKEGAAVVVPDSTTADITATFSVEPGKLNSYRTIIILGQGAKASYTERSFGKNKTDTIVNHGVEVYLAENAELDFYGLQQWPASVLNLPIYRSQMAAHSKLNWLMGSFGSKVTQLYVESGLAGEGAETNIHAVYYGDDTQHLEQSLVANHLSPHTTSDTYARGIVDDASKAVYRGMIKIQPGAHGSSADQNGHAMLLKNSAHADAIPGLEIDANDVTAGHGATVGQVDEEQLFYLMARGLSKTQATKMIIQGFFEHLFRRISRQDIRKEFWSAVAAKQQ